MSLENLLILHCNIVKPGYVTSRAGDTVKDWDSATRTASKVWMRTNRVKEDEGLGVTAEMEVVFMFASSVDVESEDRIEVGSHAFNVIGPPMPKYSKRGLHHYEVRANGDLSG